MVKTEDKERPHRRSQPTTPKDAGGSNLIDESSELKPSQITIGEKAGP